MIKTVKLVHLRPIISKLDFERYHNTLNLVVSATFPRRCYGSEPSDRPSGGRRGGRGEGWGGGRGDIFPKKINKNNPFRGHDYDPNREPRSECGYFDGDQLYGMASIRLAILSGRREIRELLVQENNEPSNKKDKALVADLLKLANEKGIRIREFPKHDLNLLVENRPHQGFVLRVAPLQLQKIDALERSATFRCVLALDEIEDPQNFGALLRTSHYLGVDRVVVRVKNTAPLSPTVSNISSGALEIVTINRVDSMMKFLEKSQRNGWQVRSSRTLLTATQCLQKFIKRTYSGIYF